MKKNISVVMDNEKMSALLMFLEQGNKTLDDEIGKAVEQLYQKTVPQNVREFIEMKSARKG